MAGEGDLPSVPWGWTRWTARGRPRRGRHWPCLWGRRPRQWNDQGGSLGSSRRSQL